MANDFDFFQSEDDDDELPDWLLGTSDDDEDLFAEPATADFPPPPTVPIGEEPEMEMEMEPEEEADAFDQLRERTALASEVYEDIEVRDSRGGGILAAISPGQRLILALLVLLNVGALALFLLVFLEIVTLF
jgi:hypothetical protein